MNLVCRLGLLTPTFLLLLSAGCVSDPNLETEADAGDAVVDGSGDAADAGAGADAEEEVSACASDLIPADGDACDCLGEERDASDAVCERTCTCSGGFWTCEERCEEPDPVVLRFTTTPSLREATGNGDANIQAGETWEVLAELVVDNAEDEGLSVFVRLDSDDGALRFDPELTQRTIEGVGQTPVSLALPFTVSDTARPSDVVATLDASSGFLVASVEVPIAISGPDAALLEWGEAEFERVEGDVDRQIELGERWEVVVPLRNAGDRDATDLRVEARASSAAIVPDASGIGVPARVDAGATVTVRWPFAVGETLIELEPLLTLDATAGDTEPVQLGVPVPIVPPDTLAVVGYSWSGTPPDLELAVEVENAGALDVTGLEWTRINYASPTPCGGDAEPPCEDPLVRSMALGEPDGPGAIAAGTSASVRLTLTQTVDTPRDGRVLLRATSRLRAHGPYPVDVTLP